MVAGNGIDPTASLSPTPPTIFNLWEEYQHGLGGRKAARIFTPQERGRNKFKYSRRKVIWETIATFLVRSGFTANVAMDRIYQIYRGNSTVTTIINRLRNSDKRGMIMYILFR